jgi:hypothetical protein
MRPLGKIQRELLYAMTCGRFRVTSDSVCKSLVARGLMKSHGLSDDSFFHVTPAGLRAIADDIDAGRETIILSFDKIVQRSARTADKEGRE